jgi:hypothetical protein
MKEKKQMKVLSLFCIDRMCSVEMEEEKKERRKKENKQMNVLSLFCIDRMCSLHTCSLYTCFDRALYFPTLSHFLIVNKTSLSLGGRVLAVNAGARVPRGGVTRQGVVLTDLQSLCDCQ